MEHLITPPPELMEQWVIEACPECRLTYDEFTGESVISLAIAAARWGADQELEACCEWFAQEGYTPNTPTRLRAARRPKPPSEANQALEALDRMDQFPTAQDQHTIRRALERLKELENAQ